MTGQAMVAKLKQCIKDESQPIAKRMSTLFELKQIGTDEALDTIAVGLASDSVLLAHEAAYVLGQMKNLRARDVLEDTLSDEKLDPVVRHEAAEALAAIGSQESVPLLEKFSNDPLREVAETCQISLARLEWMRKDMKNEEQTEPIFESVDPAPPLHSQLSITELGDRLNNQSLSLFDRYKAMFALRDLGTEDAVLNLIRGFNPSETSAVFRHEIAYVLGQLMHPASVPALQVVLTDETEHAMVRHEAAEALGAIPDAKAVKILHEYLQDKDQIVSESCFVALDIHDHWHGNSHKPQKEPSEA